MRIVLEIPHNAALLFKRLGGHAVAQLVEALRYKLEGCGFDSRSFRSHWGPGSTQPLTNEYQEHFLAGKGGRCVGLTT
jgi:hypothetical protein